MTLLGFLGLKERVDWAADWAAEVRLFGGIGAVWWVIVWLVNGSSMLWWLSIFGRTHEVSSVLACVLKVDDDPARLRWRRNVTEYLPYHSRRDMHGIL